MKFKSIICLTIIISLFMSILPANAAVTDANSVNKMFSLIDRQNFSGTTSISDVKNYINHFTYTSDFAAFYQRKFNYPNNSKDYFYTISDGTYTKNVGGAKGCYAHSKFVSLVVYGENGPRKYHTEKAKHLTGEGLKAFLLKEAQAGEHLRIDSRHSVIFVSGDDNGFYYFSYNGDDYGKKILLVYKKYADFASKYNGVSSSEQSSIWLYNANSNINSGNPTDDDKEPEKTKPTIDVSQYPTTIEQGKQFGLRGTISSKNNVTSVKGYITNSKGSVVMSTSESPNAKTNDIRYLELNECMMFDELSAGTYTLSIVAKDSSGGGSTSWEKQFTVKPKTNTSPGNNNDSSSNTPPSCKHNYNDSGYCKNCNKEYPMSISSMNATAYQTVKNDVPVRYRPYAPDTIIKYLSKGTTVTAVASGKNSQGNLWYKMSDGTWIFSGNLEKVKNSAPAESTMKINVTQYPATIDQGKVFGLRGEINSNYNVTSVKGYIKNSSGSVVMSTTDSPNEKSNNIRYLNVNQNMLFDKLSAGTYILEISAKDASGKTCNWSKSFTVKGASNKPASCNHSYNDSGYCSKCNHEYTVSLSSVNATFETVKNDVPVRYRPYSPDKIIKYLSKGTKVTAVASGKNSKGNLWYKMNDGTWIFSGNLKKVSTVSTNSVAISNVNQTLRKGSSGSAVRELQTALNKIIGAGLSVDGDFGNATKNAVEKFQSKYGLSVDGVAGPKTLGKINEILR